MPSEFHPESIRFTSDRIGCEGFRALVRELPDRGEAASGRHGRTCFVLASRPVREKGRTSLCFEEAGFTLDMGRISSIIPPDEPYVIRWQYRHLRRPPALLSGHLARGWLGGRPIPGGSPAAFCDQPPGGLALPVAPGGNRTGRPRRADLLRAPRRGAAVGRGVAKRLAASRGGRRGNAVAAHPASRCPDGDQLRLRAQPGTVGGHVGLERLPFQPAVPSGGGGEPPPVPGGLSATACPRTAGCRPRALNCRGSPRMRLCRPGAFGAALPARLRGEPRPVPKRARTDKPGAHSRPRRRASVRRYCARTIGRGRALVRAR